MQCKDKVVFVFKLAMKIIHVGGEFCHHNPLCAGDRKLGGL